MAPPTATASNIEPSAKSTRGPSGQYLHEDAFDQGYLKVGNIHTLYYEQYGKKDGKIALYLHGGPGGRISKSCTGFFNPAVYRVVLFDQRGAGRSTPRAEIRENTSQHLVEDIEAIRKHLNIATWDVVFGGSWGSTLALLYSQAYPDVVKYMILRGIFTSTQFEYDWFFTPGGGGAQLFPERYERLRDHIPPEEQGDLIAAYYKRFHSPDPEVKRAAAREWSTWELSTNSLIFNPEANLHSLEEEGFAESFAGLETHYFLNKCFIEEGQLTRKENLEKIAHIPTILINGRYDAICPSRIAYELHKALPKSVLHFIPDAGHSAMESGTLKKLIESCDESGKL